VPGDGEFPPELEAHHRLTMPLERQWSSNVPIKGKARADLALNIFFGKI